MKLAGVLVLVATWVLFVGSRPTYADGWSLNPFASKTETKPVKPQKPATAKTAPKSPGVLDKIGSGTKKFFGGVGETLGMKKADKKPASLHSNSLPPASGLAANKTKQSKPSSWNPFRKAEPKPPQSLNDFMGMKRLDP